MINELRCLTGGRKPNHFMFANRWVILGIALVLPVLAACALVLARPTKIAESGIEHVGGATVVHGRGSGAAVGYLPSGRYRVTLLESANNCAIGLHLEGADHHEWFSFSLHRGPNYRSYRGTPGSAIYGFNRRVFRGWPRRNPHPGNSVHLDLRLHPSWMTGGH